MAAGGKYDGEIRIAVNVVTEEFQKQMDGLGKTMKKGMTGISQVLKIIGATALGVALVFTLITAAILGIVRGMIGLYKKAEQFTNQLYSSLSASSAMRGTVVALQSGFEAVKGAVMAIGATLLNAVAPILLKIIGWLIQAINWVSMMIASITGQKKVMQYVSGAADAAEKGTGGMAKNLEKAKGAAEGALAAFDELNVLAQETDETPMGGGMPGGETMLTEVDVPENFAADQWAKIVEIWETIVVPALKQSWEDFWTGVWEWLLALGTTWLKMLLIVPLLLVAGFVWLWAKIKIIGAAIWKFLVGLWNGLVDSAGSAWNGIKTLVAIFLFWLITNVIDPIGVKFAAVVDGVKLAWETAFEGILDFVKGIINTIIGFMNAMIAGLIAGINTAIRAINRMAIDVPYWVPGIGGQTWGFNIATITAPEIPLLAGGAVIPPNAPFAAVLGDQRSGKNIEAPENLIREIIQEEVGQIQGDFTFNFGGSMGELVRNLKPYLDKEDVRVGESIVQRSTM